MFATKHSLQIDESNLDDNGFLMLGYVRFVCNMLPHEEIILVISILTDTHASSTFNVILSLINVLSMFNLYSRESEWYRYLLDWTSALGWELPFPMCLGHLSST